MLKSLFGTWSCVLVKSKKLRNKFLASIRDCFPGWIVKVEFTQFNFLHNFLIRRAVKWWDTWKDDIGNNTDWPNITFGAIILVKDFWSNVVWSSEFFIKLLSFLNNKWGSEINNLNLVKFFIGFKKNVLRFKISMNNMVTMAVVNTGENLFD